MKSNFIEYMAFFEKWIYYQFPRVEDDWDNLDIIRKVASIVKDDEGAAYWGDRDCWTMHETAKKQLQKG
jgi:hypothetical protein